MFALCPTRAEVQMRRTMPFSSDASKLETVGRRVSMRSVDFGSVKRGRAYGVGCRTGTDRDIDLRASR